jgi:hypothetical protein
MTGLAAAIVSRGIAGSRAMACSPASLGSIAIAATVDEIDLEHAGGRVTRYRIMAPNVPGDWRIVLFSHGANSSNESYDLLWREFAARGYLVIGPNHPDSGAPQRQSKFARSQLWRARIADLQLPFDRRSRFDAWAGKRRGNLQWRGVCAAGHSFGAVVAQALAGATLCDPETHVTVAARRDAVAACMAFSPPGPLLGFIPDDAWRTVTVPSLLQTGDADVLPGFVDDWRARLTGFGGAPDRWSLVGRGVDHYFGGLICRLKSDATVERAALDETASIAGDFLDAYLRRRPSALRALAARVRLADDGVLTLSAA